MKIEGMEQACRADGIIWIFAGKYYWTYKTGRWHYKSISDLKKYYDYLEVDLSGVH